MTLREQFVIPKKYNTLSLAFMAVGVLSIIILFITHGTSSDEHVAARFWASILQNSVYFLLVTNAAMFFICATTLAWGGWQMSFRRVSEAISTCVPVIGVIALAILLALIFGSNHVIYHWASPDAVHDPAIEHKSGFLNKGFFAVWTVITIAGWWLLGKKMRQLSRSIDDRPLTIAEGKKYIWNNTVWAAVYTVFFALTVLSSIPWLWLMSIDAHWYSTMYSWYTFASVFVAAIALITLFVVYLKNNGYLELTTKEHLHDLGKFIFAFSIFWTYLWFAQFMLIWYANIPEETIYFKPRLQGPYRAIFWLNLIINFLAPLLLLMKRAPKRNYGTITMMSVLILFGHWLDFYQMVMPTAVMNPETKQTYVPNMLADLGIALGFVGLIMFVTVRSLAKHPLVAKNHPFLKESIVHHT
ncbi:quinol:cytochrome C oxidoreductase [Flavisolibacter ginsenosidimutans]|uniref:Quinol:cytochrome C oxidoreductase n=1 Tax=Flavisolibacter ginsenosidimutans TaxID=661481 RepID=A0A5B8UKZ6_9BACT|nr:quinol:cytochrome C oxidoreductase [Flavisolibacter ginsenosidimutans]QEC57371.1 quinol:cytochrome C oxidoreductase [Flavisolibacter ginsenosidimutans]